MTNKMKVTFIVCNPDLSGGSRIIAKQAGFLKRAGHHVTIIGVDTLHQKFPKNIRPIARAIIKERSFPKNSVITDHFDNEDTPPIIIRRPNGPKPEDVPDADFIVATFWLTAQWIKDFPLVKGKKVYFIQGYEPLFPSVTDPKIVEDTYRYPFIQLGVCQWLCEKVDAVSKRQKLSPSSFQKGALSRCNLISNGVDTKKFNAPERQKNETPTVGILYSSVRLKNVDLGFKSIEILKKTIPNLKVICFGAHPPDSELPLPEGTEFYLKPPQDKISDIYSACDAWLFTSHHEGFGLPLLEAMACRTPVIATIAGASPEIVTDQTGSLCEERTPEAFAKHIEKIITQTDEEWLSMSQNARKMAEEYDWSGLQSEFENTLFKYFDA